MVDVSTAKPSATAEPAESAKDRLVSIFSHELRSHIAPIKNVAELLRCSTPDGPTTRRVAGIIQRQIDGITRLLDELLCSTRANASDLFLRYQQAVFQNVVERSVEMIQPLAQERGQTLSIFMPSAPIEIEADAMWLTHAVQNLIGNAIKYTDSGGTIDIVVKHDGADAEISVRDTGIGLAPASLTAVFDLYTRVADTGSRPYPQGLGVGLYVAQVVVDAHGGSLRAMSDGPGRGSTFVMRIPCRR